MFEPNPFGLSETLRIIESRPLDATVRPNIRAISVVPDPEDDATTARREELDEVLCRLDNPERVRLFHVDYDSRLAELPHLSRFKNIEYAYIEGRKIRGYEVLGSLGKLSHLLIVNYKDRDLRRFGEQVFEVFRAIRGGLEHVEIRSRFVFLQQCTKLISFGEMEIQKLWLESCNRVDLSTVGNIRKLVELHLLSAKSIPSFEFLRSCHDLEELVVSGNPLNKTDLGALRDIRKPRRIFLVVKDALIADLASANPHVIFTNGDVCYVDGEQVATTAPFYER